MSSPREIPIPEFAPETLPTETDTSSLKQTTPGSWYIRTILVFAVFSGTLGTAAVGAMFEVMIPEICWNRSLRPGISKKADENFGFDAIMLAGGILFPIGLVLVFMAEKLVPEKWQGWRNMWWWGLLYYVALVCLTAAMSAIMHADVKCTVARSAVGEAIFLFVVLSSMELDNRRKGSTGTRQPVRSA